ncbi:hypothetical protein HJG60_009979 [Phyllostomus discolor]|uniref:Uncharacterized protein n=1 Tax=Phyllostomus discolor TaxID=89673 RepID=A0A834BCT9_9CHIR|nr:hypothetical protein HJG60_009979 [Phyllostomus discolor]
MQAVTDAGEDVAKRKPLLTVSGKVQPLWKPVRRFIRKLQLELLHDPGIPLLGGYLKKAQTLTQKHVCTSKFTVVLFTATEIRKQPTCPPVHGRRRICETHTHLRRNTVRPDRREVLPVATTRWILRSLC